jgi:hypothetical protein
LVPGCRVSVVGCTGGSLSLTFFIVGAQLWTVPPSPSIIYTPMACKTLLPPPPPPPTKPHVWNQLLVLSSTPQSGQSAMLFSQSSELGLAQPLTRRRVCPQSLVPGGGAHSLAREGVGSPNSDEGTYNVVPLTSACSTCQREKV